MARKINSAGLDLIKSFEGCRLKAYKDIVGVVTIGYGATGPDIEDGMVWTQEQADERLARDLEKFCAGVEELVQVDINDNQFASLVAFSYNVGLNALSGSTLLKKLNDGDFDGAVEQFARWSRAGGKIVDGLARRREAEANLFTAAL